MMPLAVVHRIIVVRQGCAEIAYTEQDFSVVADGEAEAAGQALDIAVEDVTAFPPEPTGAGLRGLQPHRHGEIIGQRRFQPDPIIDAVEEEGAVGAGRNAHARIPNIGTTDAADPDQRASPARTVAAEVVVSRHSVAEAAIAGNFFKSQGDDGGGFGSGAGQRPDRAGTLEINLRRASRQSLSVRIESAIADPAGVVIFGGQHPPARGRIVGNRISAGCTDAG